MEKKLTQISKEWPTLPPKLIQKQIVKIEMKGSEQV